MVGGSGKGGHLSELNQSNAKDALGTLKSDFWNEYTAAVNEGRSLDAGLVKQVKEFKKFAPQLYPDMSPELAKKKYVDSLLREPQNALQEELTDLLFKSHTTANKDLKKALMKEAKAKYKLLYKLDPDATEAVLDSFERRVNAL